MSLAHILLSVVTGALIGLVTNGLAIAMLFRPWRPWTIGPWRVPFTPGLIPRRREEIARRLGDIVEEHLLPAEGIRQALDEANARRAFDEAWERLLEWVEREGIRAASQAVAGWAGSGDSSGLSGSTSALFAALRNGGLTALRKIMETETGRAWTEAWTRGLLQMAGEAVQDLRVRRLVTEAIQGWLSRQGWIGRLAGALGAEERVADELLGALREWLSAPGASEAVTNWVRRMLLPEIIGTLERLPDGGQQMAFWVEAVRHQLAEQPWTEETLARLWAWLKLRREDWEPRFREWLLGQLESALPRVWQYIPVARIVENQINRFPLAEFERLVLEVSRRELAMITWMGGVLGGVVGLGQALLAAVL
ncbi:MAG: DUF445 family protein [Alicyclobacillaceae bacterium]|nr:DUF445 family protein [Alicyclobacillaceae bacterium]